MLEVGLSLLHSFFANEIVDYEFDLPKDGLGPTKLGIVVSTVKNRLGNGVSLVQVNTTA